MWSTATSSPGPGPPRRAHPGPPPPKRSLSSCWAPLGVNDHSFYGRRKASASRLRGPMAEPVMPLLAADPADNAAPGDATGREPGGLEPGRVGGPLLQPGHEPNGLQDRPAISG